MHGLAVYGVQLGAVMDVEAVAVPGTGRQAWFRASWRKRSWGESGRRLRRKSMARASADSVLTLLRGCGFDLSAKDLHIQFPGGAPVDGAPPQGVAMAAAAASALDGQAA